MIEKLAALVPPRRLNLIRYHVILAPNAAGRARIVPGPKDEDAERETGCLPAAELTPGQRRHRGRESRPCEAGLVSRRALQAAAEILSIEPVTPNHPANQKA